MRYAHCWRWPYCLLALATLAGCYAAEGSGEIVHETYAVDGFTEVVLSGTGQATIVQGEYRVTASADSDVLPSVRVERRGEALILRREVDWIDGVRPTVPVDYRISMPTLHTAKVSGSGSLKVRGATGEGVGGEGVGVEELRLAVSGAGTIDVAAAAAHAVTVDVSGASVVSISTLQAGSLRVDISGAGRVATDGSVDNAAVEVSGSGVFRGSRLRAATASVRVSGAGQALVQAVDKLEAHASGAGRVTYFGEPVVEKIVQGAGQVVTAR